MQIFIGRGNNFLDNCAKTFSDLSLAFVVDLSVIQKRIGIKVATLAGLCTVLSSAEALERSHHEVDYKVACVGAFGRCSGVSGFF